MSKLCVRLFGTFHVQIDACDLLSFDGRKVQELFSYLLMHREHTHSREVLASLLWPDSSTVQSKRNLRQTLWQMQSGLSAQSIPEDERVLCVQAEWVQVNRNAELWLDVAEFEDTFSMIRGRPGSNLDLNEIRSLRRAVDLYRGDLLEGWYQDWCIYERERLQTMYLAMLDKLMAHCEAHQEYEAGLAYGEQILRYDRAHEQTHCRLMNLYYLAGHRATALRQYHHCVTALQEELGAQPSRRTTALYERIQRDRHEEASRETTAANGLLSDRSAALQGLMQRLKQHWNVMVDLERRMLEDIEKLELALQCHDETIN